MKTQNKLKVTLRDLEIEMTREFDAPRDLVWKACTQAEHIPQWWGSRQDQTLVHELDFRLGGAWRFECISPDGQSYVFNGEYLEITAPERLVNTFGIEGMFDGKSLIESYHFEDLGGRTRITTITRFESNADRDGMAATGMEAGAAESYQRLEALLESLMNQPA